MKIVIQCAASKHRNAGSFRWEGRRVNFVARPDMAPQDGRAISARPDDRVPGGTGSWRDHLVHYNETGSNPDGLLPAIDLYEPEVYRRLGSAFGSENVFVLSAGWGLVRGTYLLPDYDITFSSQADAWKKRTGREHYQDFNHLADALAGASGERVVFFGGQSYLDLLGRLAKGLGATVVAYRRVPDGQPPGRTVSEIPASPGRLAYADFPTARKTNWHYDCAAWFIEGAR